MNSLAPREGYVGLYAAEHPPSPKLRRGRQMSNDEKNNEYFPAYASRILGSPRKRSGSLPAALPATSLAHALLKRRYFPVSASCRDPAVAGLAACAPKQSSAGRMHYLPSQAGNSRGVSREFPPLRVPLSALPVDDSSAAAWASASVWA